MTLSTMYTRILGELENRGSSGSLTAATIDAINSAIAHHERERWFWNENRTTYTFSASAGQEFYTATATQSWISNIVTIDSVLLTSSSSGRFPVERVTYEELERISVNPATTGEPSRFSYYARALRFYPIPDQAYALRVSGVFRLTPRPLVSASATNAWLDDAEEMIRQRAKWDLALNILLDPEQAAIYAAAEQVARMGLRAETTRRLSSGRVRASSF